ncbi:uncharacterized protein LOC115762969, partial [Drosophila novamexicana]
MEINTDIEYRSQFRVLDTVDGEEVDLTPNYIPESPYTDQFLKFNMHLKHEMVSMPQVHSRGSTARSRTRSSMRGGVGGNKQSIDELINGIMYETILFDPGSSIEKPNDMHMPVPFN